MLAYCCPKCSVVVPVREWRAHRIAEGIPQDRFPPSIAPVDWTATRKPD